MKEYSFRRWMEYADFGMDQRRLPGKIMGPDDEKPIYPLNVEYVINDLKRQKMGIKEAVNTYFGEIQWGKDSGAVKLTFSPYRGLHVVVRKLTTDALGESVWVCKKVIEVGNNYDKKADSLIMDLFNILEEVDKTDIESANINYNKLENFVLRLGNALKTETTQKILFYEGIKRITEGEHYIIHYGVKGMGVQALGQRRVNQLQVEVKYKKDKGLIQITCNELGSKLDKDNWQLSPSQFSEWYTPSQDEAEIISSVLHQLNSY